MLKTDRAARKRREKIVYLLAAILMFVRTDFWWWGKETPLILFGWLTAPMLYQFGIWLAGWMLVLYTANRIWTENGSD